MRAVFINYSHPDTPHVSAVRVPTFARILAHRGHQVVLATMPREGVACDLTPLADRFRAHNWQEPFHLTWPLLTSPLLARLLARELPAWRSKLLTAWWYGARGGMRWDWTEPGLFVMEGLKQHWRADVVWGSFGQLDVVHLAQQTARLMDCPWCLDIKDNWTFYVPRGMRRWMAQRYGDPAAISANAWFHRDVVRTYFRREATVIYSGVDESLYDGEPPTSDTFNLVLIGSLYGVARVAGFIDGLRAWLAGLPVLERKRVRVIYVGCDERIAESVLDPLRESCAVEIRGYIPVREMMALCRGTAVNAYMWLPRTFHHKLIELLWCRRPILAFPGEHGESVEIARRVGGDLRVCRDPGEVARTLADLWSAGRRTVDSPEEALRKYTWERQADVLESMLQAVLKPGKDADVALRV